MRVAPSTAHTTEDDGALLHPPMLAVLDADGVIREVNEPWTARYEACGGNAKSCGAGVDYLRVCDRTVGHEARYAQAAAEGLRRVLSRDALSFRLVYPCLDHRFEMHATPIERGGAAVLHIDITEEIRTREHLDRSEARFRAAADASHDAVYVLDAVRDEDGALVDFVFAAVNPAAEKQLSRSAGELLGRRVCDLFPIDRTGGFFGKYKRVVETGEALFEELEIPPDAPAPGWYQYQVVPLGDGVAVTARDVSAARRMEMELRESREKLVAITRAAPAIVYQYLREPDGAARFTFVSERARELWGLEPEEAMADLDRVLALTHPEDREEVERRAVDSARSLEPYRAEIRVVLAGETRWHAIRSIPRRLPDGSTEWTGVVMDVTERRRAEQERLKLETQMLAAQKLESLGLLAGGVAHDFNNLLVAMLGHASLAQAELDAASPARESVDALVAAAERAAGLTRQMLAYAGRASLQTRLTDPASLVRESLDLLRSAVPRSVELIADLPGTAPRVAVDRGQFEQVLMNLVLNAAEALKPAGGSVRISFGERELTASQAGDWRAGGAQPEPGRFVIVSVEDDGPGIPEAIRSSLFDPFVSTMGEGRGLGLAAVSGIVRAHRGGLRVRTGAEGTRFDLLFRVAGPEEERESDPTSSAEGAPGTDAPRPAPTRQDEDATKVLIIDDDEHVTRLIGRVLRREGIDVVSAGDGAAGIDRFRERSQEIAAIVLDLSMPGLSGEETLAALREISATVPVLLSSGLPPQEVRSRFERLGANGFLAKPYTAGRLVQAIRELIGG